MAKRRIPQVNELIKQELGKILLRKIEFPKGTLVTVTRVESSQNLIESKVYISTIPENQTLEVSKILNRNIFDIQQIINTRLKMRPIPKIKFVEEKKTKKAETVEGLLEKIKETTEKS